MIDFLAQKFDRIEKNFDEIKTGLGTKADKSDVTQLRNELSSRITTLGDKIDDYRADQSGPRSQINEHREWIDKASPKIGVKLPG